MVKREILRKSGNLVSEDDATRVSSSRVIARSERRLDDARAVRLVHGIKLRVLNRQIDE